MDARLRRPAPMLVAVIAAVAIAVPVLGQELSASPSTSPDASATAEPSVTEAPPSESATAVPATEAPATQAPVATAAPATPAETAKPAKPDKADKGDREPKVPVSLTGRIGKSTDADGDAGYTLTVGSTVYTLEIGPKWWWGDADPLAGLVGRVVSLEGERAPGSTSIDVLTAGGTKLREAGKPPWAGGWKVVGERHPGWAQWKADKFAAKLARWAAKWPDGKPGKGPSGVGATAP